MAFAAEKGIFEQTPSFQQWVLTQLLQHIPNCKIHLHILNNNCENLKINIDKCQLS